MYSLPFSGLVERIPIREPPTTSDPLLQYQWSGVNRVSFLSRTNIYYYISRPFAFFGILLAQVGWKFGDAAFIELICTEHLGRSLRQEVPTPCSKQCYQYTQNSQT